MNNPTDRKKEIAELREITNQKLEKIYFSTESEKEIYEMGRRDIAKKALAIINSFQNELEQEKGQRDFYREKYLKAKELRRKIEEKLEIVTKALEEIANKYPSKSPNYSHAYNQQRILAKEVLSQLNITNQEKSGF